MPSISTQVDTNHLLLRDLRKITAKKHDIYTNWCYTSDSKKGSFLSDMRKSIILILILAVLLGGGYYLYSQGLIDKWFPGLLEKVIPGYESPASVNGGRVSSDA